MKLFDSHCHLDDSVYDSDLHEVIRRMHSAGVDAAMIGGLTLERCGKSVAIAESTARIYASVGIHPHDAKDCNEDVLKTWLIRFGIIHAVYMALRLRLTLRPKSGASEML